MAEKKTIFREDNIEDYYDLDIILGEGTYSVVKKAKKKGSNELYAVKIIDKENIKKLEKKELKAELEKIAEVNHPNIIKIFEVFDSKESLYIVTEIMTGGEVKAQNLFDRLVEKEFYSENEAAETIKSIVEALRFSHSKGVLHHDLKPENFYYTMIDSKVGIKISDFGLFGILRTDFLSTSSNCTYIAPELIEGMQGDEAADFWSLGIILYVLLCGYPPFYDDSIEGVYALIKKGKYEFPSPHWDQISDFAKDLINHLLVVEPSKRYDADTILKHPWMVSTLPKQDLSSVPVKIKEFNARRRLKRAQFAVLASNRLNVFKKIAEKK